MKKNLCLLLSLLTAALISFAQETLDYQKPCEEILNLVDIQRAPYTLFDQSKENVVFIYRDAYKSIEDLSKEELRLGGLRIDPATSIGSRTTFYNNLMVQHLGGSVESSPIQVQGLPEKPRLSHFQWSPDERKIAFANTHNEGVELWVLDIASAKATKITSAKLNANVGSAFEWFGDSESLLVKMISPSKQALIDTTKTVPTGPTISESDGKKAQNRTYQDLLKNKTDEFNFEQLVLSELHRVTLSGDISLWAETAMYSGMEVSPDGEYVLVTTIEKPFSYLVQYDRFPSASVVYNKNGTKVETIVEVPLIEDLPKGFMATCKGRRAVDWRNDKPSSIIYVKALDQGDPEVEVDYRDEVFELSAPFGGEGHSILKLKQRYNRMIWGTDEQAIAYDYWWNTRNLKTYLFNPEDSSWEPKILFDRNYQDRYSDPGYFVTHKNLYGKSVLSMKGETVFLLGDGCSDEGQFPFLDSLELSTGKTERIYRSVYEDRVENLYDYDPEKNRLLVRIESPKDYPNYSFRELAENRLDAITHFPNPFESIKDIYKEVIRYQREDGLDLTATLYLPANYDFEKKEQLPMILWAYPREFKDRSSAGQNTQNPNEFTYPFYGSPIYWVTRGYAVLDDAAFPIVGVGDEEPNDTFRSQLVADAKAAIDAVDALGYIDRRRVGVGGHSYGAFMVANLLSHSDLFAAGVARSGAYNRTLTPFEFQSEERYYWDAPEVYYAMSPFMHADKMKTPLLLIHGEADNNSGTYPMQSERYFNAIKGLGGPVRLVILPKESHSYRAKESILHLLWEQDTWFEKYVKNRPQAEEE